MKKKKVRSKDEKGGLYNKRRDQQLKEFLVVSVLEFREWVGMKEKEERKVKRHD